MDKEWINRGYIGDKGCENMKKKTRTKGTADHRMVDFPGAISIIAG